MQQLKRAAPLLLSLFITLVSACTTQPAAGNGPAMPPVEKSAETVNINAASAAELQRLPHVGEALAAKIIEHRERHGRFRKPEHLMLVEGISDARFRRIRHLISIE